MKKVLISILLLGSVFLLNGCGKKEEPKDEDTKKEENVITTKNLTLEDENFGITTLKFNSDKDYQIKEEYVGKYVEVYLTSEKENFKLQLYHFLTNDISYETNKESRKESDNFKEYTWNNLNGYTYNGSNNSIDFNIFLKNNNGEVKALFGSMETINNDNTSIIEIFENIQKLLNTITFTE